MPKVGLVYIDRCLDVVSSYLPGKKRDLSGKFNVQPPDSTILHAQSFVFKALCVKE